MLKVKYRNIWSGATFIVRAGEGRDEFGDLTDEAVQRMEALWSWRRV